MIDCNITANYFAEKERLCASILECIDCPLRHGNDCTNIENKYRKGQSVLYRNGQMSIRKRHILRSFWRSIRTQSLITEYQRFA